MRAHTAAHWQACRWHWQRPGGLVRANRTGRIPRLSKAYHDSAIARFLLKCTAACLQCLDGRRLLLRGSSSQPILGNASTANLRHQTHQPRLLLATAFQGWHRSLWSQDTAVLGRHRLGGPHSLAVCGRCPWSAFRKQKSTTNSKLLRRRPAIESARLLADFNGPCGPWDQGLG